jgi:hypothetical protein
VEPHELTVPGLHASAAPIIAAYLAELDRLLPAGRRARRAILAEIADGLACEVSDRMGRHEPAPAAARAAVSACGDPRAVAAAFTDQLVLAMAHRTGRALLLTGPVVGLAWITAYAHDTGGWHVGSVLAAVPFLAAILVVAVPSAVVATTGAGWPARHVRFPARWLSGAVLIATIGCVAVDTLLLSAAVSGRAGLGPITMVAAVASAVRLTAAAWAARRVAGIARSRPAHQTHR